MSTDVVETVKLDLTMYSEKLRADRDQIYRLPPLTDHSIGHKVNSTDLPSLSGKGAGIPVTLMSKPVTSVKVQQLYEDTKQHKGVGNITDRSIKKVQHTKLDEISEPVSLPPVPNAIPKAPGSSAVSSAKPSAPSSAAASFLTPEMAMKQYMQKMTPYEHHEIFNYSQIYFVGPNAKKRQGAIGDPNNSGYDDDEGSYILVAHDHVAYRYEILKLLGKGSFGQVIKAIDHKTGQQVALKIVRNEKRFNKQAQEEIRILELLKKQDKDNTMNVVHIMDHFSFRNHICMVFEMLSINLYELIKKNKFKGFSVPLVKKIAHPILVCLNMLYRNKIIHCDMKPENVLLKQPGRSSIKVIDFGSSCYEHQRIYTYIQSRFYRAPEVILGAKYGMPIDMWSLGCILVELVTGYPLFPGEDEGDQMACIMEVIGMPPQKVLAIGKRSNNFISSKGYPRYCTLGAGPDGKVTMTAGKSKRGKYRGIPGSKPLSVILQSSNDDLFVDFVAKCLTWDPAVRMTPVQALLHPWFRPQKAQHDIASKQVTNITVTNSPIKTSNKQPTQKVMASFKPIANVTKDTTLPRSDERKQ